MKTLYLLLFFCPLTLLSQAKDTTVAKDKFIEFLTDKQKQIQANADAMLRDLEGMKRGVAIIQQDSVKVPITLFKEN